ncbi:Meiotic recombination protein [Yarrowia sp. C11]|nr:Meiotic recombination protein [Yarrowia sp. C11]KAG5364337.1 Meiotic recombination protein [Yarrowia sp. E02]
MSLFDTYSSKGIPLTTLCGNSVNRFSIYLRLLQIIKSCLDENRITTKRDIFYDAVDIFKTQGVVDSCITRIANDLLQVPRDSLNVVAAQKGLIYSSCVSALQLTYKNNYRAPVTIPTNTTTLIPYTTNVVDIVLSPKVTKILVVEKEAVFTTLCPDVPKDTLLVTGKGYPDHLTQDFVRLFDNVLPIYICVDADPHGIHIAATYRFRSFVRASSLEGMGSTISYIGVSLVDFKRGYLPLEEKNRKQAERLLFTISSRQEEDLGVADYEEMDKWKLELQRMLFLGKVAEMNVAGDGDGSGSGGDGGDGSALARYIFSKMD